MRPFPIIFVKCLLFCFPFSSIDFSFHHSLSRSLNSGPDRTKTLGQMSRLLFPYNFTNSVSSVHVVINLEIKYSIRRRNIKTEHTDMRYKCVLESSYLFSRISSFCNRRVVIQMFNPLITVDSSQVNVVSTSSTSS